VYEARNVIYVKRGALGFIVAQKSDQTGSVALEPKEKEQLKEEIQKNYGIGGGKMPYAITDVPVDFKRTNLSIQELQPFEETLEDAIKIASVFGIPSDLVPRKDKSTYDNQIGSQKDVYTSVIIPMAKQFCQDVTRFLGLEDKGLYIDCDFSDVDCLQKGMKEAEEVSKLRMERCLMQFNAGLITLDDIRAQMHESQLAEEIPLFGKLKFQMTPEELQQVDSIIAGSTKSTTTTNSNNNAKPSTGDE
jgi:phage portal protein BeeE